MAVINIVGLCVAVLMSASPGAIAANRTIVLLGDSLINKPWNEHNLSTVLSAMLVLPPNTSVTFINSGNNGEEIASISSRTAAVLEQYQPYAVILFWDSDCSNVDESTMTPAQVRCVRANYTSHLAACVRTVLSAGVHMAVAGPELLGEGPLGLPPRFHNKTNMLNDYRNLTSGIAQTLGVPYLDIRGAFLAAIPAWWLWYKDWATQDGEHPNERGTKIEATLFAAQVNTWLAQTGRGPQQSHWVPGRGWR